MRQAGDEAFAAGVHIVGVWLAAPEAGGGCECPSGLAVRRPPLGVIEPAKLEEGPERALSDTYVAFVEMTSAYKRLGRAEAEGGTYPFDCGTHAAKVPGNGKTDFSVHVSSSHDTQSAGRLSGVANITLKAASMDTSRTFIAACTSIL